MFKARGAGAIGLILAGLASIGWAVALWYVVRPEGTTEPIWPAATLVSAVFTLVGGLLYATGHPDARVVGFFGALIFAIPNLLVAITSLMDRLRTEDCAGAFLDPCTAAGVLDGGKVVLLLTGAVALTLLQLLVMLFASPKPTASPPAAAL